MFILVGGEGGEAAGVHVPELPDLVTLLFLRALPDASPETVVFKLFGSDLFAYTVKDISTVFYFTLALVIVLGWAVVFSRLVRVKPGSRFAIFTEWVVDGLRRFFGEILGAKEVDRYIGLVGGLFVVILFMNFFELVVLMKPPSSVWGINFGMALVVFFATEITELVRNGPKKYFLHLVGYDPSLPLVMTVLLGALFAIIHLMEKLMRPVSLSLRLFGNIFSKDVLLAVFGGLVVGTVGTGLLPKFMGVFLYFFFIFLAALLSVIQAVIFSLLSTLYIALSLPHEEHAHEEAGHAA